MVTSNAAHRGEEGNPYEINALGVLQLYGQFIDGDADCTLAIVSSQPLSSRARTAIEASAERLGHRAEACAWVNLSGEGNAGKAPSGEPIAAQGSEPALGAQDLLTLLEGLDPTAVIATDAAAVSLISSAYETTMKMDAANRAACRTVVALADFEAALDDTDAKQKAWHALKKISR